MRRGIENPGLEAEKMATSGRNGVQKFSEISLMPSLPASTIQ
jgi:hypothetical protein